MRLTLFLVIVLKAFSRYLVPFLLGLTIGLLVTIFASFCQHQQPSLGTSDHFTETANIKPTEEVDEFIIAETHHQELDKEKLQKIAYRATIENVRVLCLVLTTEKYHMTRAIFVKMTWGSHCDGLVFVSDADDPELGAMRFHSNSSYYEIWAKVKRAYKWAYDNYIDDFDWFVKADDDSFLIVENLKLRLSHFDPDQPVYTGRHFNDPSRKTKKGYAPGGPGYAISRGGLKRLVEHGYQASPKHCPKALVSKGEHYEDINMGRCLDVAGVTLLDSRHPVTKEQTFHYVQPERHLLPKEKLIREMKFYDFYGPVRGWGCCSEASVSFHYIKERELIGMYYLIYKLRPFSPMNLFGERPESIIKRLRDNNYCDTKQRCQGKKESGKEQKVGNKFQPLQVSEALLEGNL